jgi:hypothetical protein
MLDNNVNLISAHSMGVHVMEVLPLSGNPMMHQAVRLCTLQKPERMISCSWLHRV